ncbi:3-isopropylmalate dehydratase small subunit [Kaistia geumhonensis]|uniref:3-isopropylmalate dehydratase small subunit n=1 Tax=Kaistia geumhonensis TaxID=410839 RepID=A0ABU0MAD7_9HYPH|nr:3-isopropylmalate dehydratase small subunit [Kaistia geumhonensis]MCX5480560.1 3-isopropylmalate dehydratase small subunit [Kaistia geumhonensis]MDQ0517738.1 3-isopropylmalate/(R)-2-methylmalate dehydratase small subunit [Kaistia geumhonensis]
MKPFSTVTSIAAPLPEADVDTDIIFPARFLLLLDREGLGRHLFHERRRPAEGAPPFVLDRPPYDRAEILVTGPNFGTGSSREQAVWALADFGIRVVIAPRFGEIFFSNCFRNGLLPIVLGEADHSLVMRAAEAGEAVSVDLEAQRIVLADGTAIAFSIDSYRRRALLLGLDEIGAILADDAADIAAFEARQKAGAPWLHLTREQLSHFDDLRTSEA